MSPLPELADAMDVSRPALDLCVKPNAIELLKYGSEFADPCRYLIIKDIAVGVSEPLASVGVIYNEWITHGCRAKFSIGDHPAGLPRLLIQIGPKADLESVAHEIAHAEQHFAGANLSDATAHTPAFDARVREILSHHSAFSITW